jgi:hypothetical protein
MCRFWGRFLPSTSRTLLMNHTLRNSAPRSVLPRVKAQKTGRAGACKQHRVYLWRHPRRPEIRARSSRCVADGVRRLNWEVKNTDRIVAGNKPACPAEGGFRKNHCPPSGGIRSRVEYLP